MEYVDMWQIDGIWEAYSFGPDSTKTILGYQYRFYWRDQVPLIGIFIKIATMKNARAKLAKATNFIKVNANKCAIAAGNEVLPVEVREDI